MATRAKRQRVEKEEVVVEEVEENEVEKAEQRVRFDNPNAKYHDVILVVKGKKFYCDKITLARHSGYFYAMFFNDFKEKNKTEILLNDPFSSDEFHQFLRMCHGHDFITDDYVNGVLHLADLWDAKVVRDHCLDFLMGENTKKTNKEKFELGVQFGSDKLKKKALSDVKCTSELSDVLPTNLSELSPPDATLALEKSLRLMEHRRRKRPGLLEGIARVRALLQEEGL